MSGFRYCAFINFLTLAVLPTLAGAAGTYYTGAAYQPAQYRYGQSGTYATSGYNRVGNSVTQNPNARYNTYSTQSSQTNQNVARTDSRTTQQKSTARSTKSGFFARGGITHESAMWRFEMQNAKSILHYDNVAWNVLDLNGGYVFDMGNTKLQIDAGFKYGMQWDEATMSDDDITNGGYVAGSNSDIIEMGHTLSVGKSTDGNMFGFNLGIGLTDLMKFGNVKITPSIGYRYFKYKLETKDNRALSIYTFTSSGASSCYSYLGQTVCDPIIILHNGNSGTNIVLHRDDTTGYIPLVGEYSYIEPDGTAYYEQPGVSHSYDVEWSGPYIALDMDYDINQNNVINGRIELGFPGYTATGDQPYRWDWQHPKSVEDKASMFSAFHLGLGANWKTAITTSVALSLGVTYDYYTVGGANAKTYLNQDLYNYLANKTDRTPLEDAQLTSLADASQECGGWVCDSKKEIDSIYKSMGFRVGIDAKF